MMPADPDGARSSRRRYRMLVAAVREIVPPEMAGPVDRVSEVPLFRLVKSAASAFRISTDELWLVVLDALATGELSACIARVFEGEAGERRWMDLLSGARYAVAQSSADPARWPWVRAITVDAADWEIWLAANFPRKRKVPASTMPRQRPGDEGIRP